MIARRSTLFLWLFPTALVASSLVVVWSCSSGSGVTPSSPFVPDATPPRDATVDTTPPPPTHGPDPACTITDLTPGTGTKFCDLPGTDTPDLTVPPEFCVREYTTAPLVEPRVIRFAPNGDLFVSAPSFATPGGATNGPGAILVLPDDDHDGKADSVVTYLGSYPKTSDVCKTVEGDPANLSCLHGIAFADGYLYYTRSDEVRRLPYKSGDRAASVAFGELVAPLHGDGRPEMRWTHTLERKADGSLYVTRGRYDALTCAADERAKGAVLTLHVENGAKLPLEPETMADGFRNPMYVRCSPDSCNDCYANELTNDAWDGIGAREKVALLDTKGASYGFPCCVGPGQVAPGVTGYDCSTAAAERVPIPLHDTPFGMDFERGGFPDAYKHGIFVAVHGVVSSFGGTGVLFLKTDPKSLRPTGEQTAFVKGFRPMGRATDVAFAPDGRLFIADDTSGRIFWVAPRTLSAP